MKSADAGTQCYIPNAIEYRRRFGLGINDSVQSCQTWCESFPAKEAVEGCCAYDPKGAWHTPKKPKSKKVKVHCQWIYNGIIIQYSEKGSKKAIRCLQPRRGVKINSHNYNG